MGICLGKTPGPGRHSASPSSPHWPDLPPEVAGLVLARLSSHDDRLSFGAVCPAWRLAARQHGGPLQLPAMPCINLGNGTYQSIADDKVRRFPTPEGCRAGASFGGWLLCYSKGSGRCFLRAPSSNGAIDFPTAIPRVLRALPTKMRIGSGMDMKMIVCSSHLVVAIFRHPYRGYFLPDSYYFASFRPAQHQKRRRALSFDVQPGDPHRGYAYMDVAFFNGNVFALSHWEHLFRHELDGEASYLPIVYHDHMEAARQATRHSNSYLVVSADKQRLLMVRWRRRSSTAMDLWVFQADFGLRRWVEVKDLGDQVIFLGRNSSMAFDSHSSEHWSQRFPRGNRVFVLGTEWARLLELHRYHARINDIPSYCVYDMMSGETSMVFLDGGRYTKSCMSGWFFP